MKRLATILLCCSALTAIANAADVDFGAHIRDLGGADMPTSAADPSPLTLGKICSDALIANIPGDSPTADEKARRFWLAVKVHEGKEPLSADEVALVKKVVGLAYGPLVVGRVIELIDPAAVPKSR